MHYKHLQIKCFPSRLAFFFVPISAFFENRSSRGIVIKKSLVPITISFVDDVSHLQNQWISSRVVSLFSARKFSIFIWAYCHANRNTKVQTSKSMVFLQGRLALFRHIKTQFSFGRTATLIATQSQKRLGPILIATPRNSGPA